MAIRSYQPVPYRSGLRDLAESLLRQAEVKKEQDRLQTQMEMQAQQQQAQMLNQAFQQIGQGFVQAGQQKMAREQEQGSRAIQQAQERLARARERLEILRANNADPEQIARVEQVVAKLEEVAGGPIASAAASYQDLLNTGVGQPAPVVAPNLPGRQGGQAAPQAFTPPPTGAEVLSNLGATAQNYQRAAGIQDMTIQGVVSSINSFNPGDPDSVFRAYAALDQINTMPEQVREILAPNAGAIINAFEADTPVGRQARAFYENTIAQNEAATTIAQNQAAASFVDLDLLRQRYGSARADEINRAIDTGVTEGLDAEGIKGLAETLGLSPEEIPSWSQHRTKMRQMAQDADVQQATTAAERAEAELEWFKRTRAPEWEQISRSLDDASAERVVRAYTSGITSGLNDEEKAELARALNINPENLGEWSQSVIAMQEASRELGFASEQLGYDRNLIEYEFAKATYGDRLEEVRSRVGDASAQRISSALASGITLNLSAAEKREMVQLLDEVDTVEGLAEWGVDRINQVEAARELEVRLNEARVKAAEQTIVVNDQQMKLQEQTYNHREWQNNRERFLAGVQDEESILTGISQAVANNDVEFLDQYITAAQNPNSELGELLNMYLDQDGIDRLQELREGARERRALEYDLLESDVVLRAAQAESAELKLRQQQKLTPLETQALLLQHEADIATAEIRLENLPLQNFSQTLESLSSLAATVPPDFWDNVPESVAARLDQLGVDPAIFQPLSEHAAWLRGDPKRQQGWNMLEALMQAPPETEADRNMMLDGIDDAVEMMGLGPVAAAALKSSATSVWRMDDENMRLRMMEHNSRVAQLLQDSSDGRTIDPVDVKRVADGLNAEVDNALGEVEQLVTQMSFQGCLTIVDPMNLREFIAPNSVKEAETGQKMGSGTCGDLYDEYQAAYGRFTVANIEHSNAVDTLAQVTGIDVSAGEVSNPDPVPNPGGSGNQGTDDTSSATPNGAGPPAAPATVEVNGRQIPQVYGQQSGSAGGVDYNIRGQHAANANVAAQHFARRETQKATDLIQPLIDEYGYSPVKAFLWNTYRIELPSR